MKKTFPPLICLAILLLLFTACQSKLPPPPPQSFTAEAQITFGEKRFSAAIEQSCPGSLRLAFSGLPELEGMQMRLEGGTAILRYGEMELALPAPCLPQAGFAGLLGEALGQLAQPARENAIHGVSVKRAAGGWEVSGTAGGLAYTASVDMQGMLRSLRMPGAALVIELT